MGASIAPSIGGVTRLEAFDSKSQYATRKPFDTNT